MTKKDFKLMLEDLLNTDLEKQKLMDVFVDLNKKGKFDLKLNHQLIALICYYLINEESA